MSRPWNSTLPPSLRTWPVSRLKSVDLPAPFGPITAAMVCAGTSRLTSATALKPLNDLRMLRTLSILAPPDAHETGAQGAEDAAGENEHQDDQDRAEDQRPVLSVCIDLLVEQDQDRSTYGRSPKVSDASQDGHDQNLG